MYSRTLTSRVAAMLALMACALLPTATFAEGDPTGDWNVVVDMAGTPIEATMSVVKNDDGTLSGQLQSPMGEAELENVTHEGDKLAFTQTFGEGDAALTFTFEGTIDGDTFEGTLNSEMGEMKVTGTRGGAEGGSIVGKWQLTSDSQLGVITSPLVINADMTGTYAEQFEVEDLKQDGNVVSFYVEVDYEGNVLPLTFEGEMTGADSAEGIYLMDGAEVATVTITREVSLWGSWDVTSVSQLGELQHVLTLNEDISGTFDGAALESLEVEANEIYFEVNYEADGQAIFLEIEMALEGASLVGDAYADGAAVAELTGTKQGASADGVYGAWNATSESQLGTLEHKLTLNSDNTGDMDGTPLENVEIEGDEIYFEVPFEADGQAVMLEVEMVLENGELVGDVYADGAAVAEITAKR